MYLPVAVALLALPVFWAGRSSVKEQQAGHVLNDPYVIIAFIVAGLLIVLGLLILRRYHQPPSLPLDQWFTVAFDDERVTLDVRPPGGTPSVASFRWSEVTRVCFKSEDFTISDGVYIFTTLRPESFVVPTEAKGGVEFWNKVVERGLFPAEMAIRAATSREGALLCWPAHADAVQR